MAREEGWNTYADGYDAAAKDDAKEFKRLDRENAQQLEAIKLLRAKLILVLPMAKGYAHANPVGSNGAMIAAAERALEDTESFV